VIDRYKTNLDGDQVTELQNKFNSLTGYDETPEGMQRRAEDAYLLTTGQRFDAGTMDMKNIASGVGGKAGVTAPPQASADEQALRSALGISEEDIQKYGNK